MNDYGSVFDLLGIGTRSSTPNKGFNRSRRVPDDPDTGWANKDDSGNSTVNARNRRTRDKQMQEKAREAYERDMDSVYGKGQWGSDQSDPTNNGFYKQSWDEMSQAEKDAQVKHYAPHLSSADRAANRRSREADAKDKRREEAKQAVQDYVKKKEEEAGDRGLTNAERNKYKREAEALEKQKKEDAELNEGDEAEAKTSADDVDPTKPVTQGEFQAFKEEMKEHTNNTEIHSYG